MRQAAMESRLEAMLQTKVWSQLNSNCRSARVELAFSMVYRSWVDCSLACSIYLLLSANNSRSLLIYFSLILDIYLLFLTSSSYCSFSRWQLPLSRLSSCLSSSSRALTLASLTDSSLVAWLCRLARCLACSSTISLSRVLCISITLLDMLIPFSARQRMLSYRTLFLSVDAMRSCCSCSTIFLVAASDSSSYMFRAQSLAALASTALWCCGLTNSQNSSQSMTRSYQKNYYIGSG